MDKETQEKIDALEERIAQIEREMVGVALKKKTIELDIVLPEAEIDGLRFNRTEVHAVFDLKEDGWYYSRDILFMSARNVENNNRRDILTEYLNLDAVKSAFLYALRAEFNVNSEGPDITISLPAEYGGVKLYNGVRSWYWLENSSMFSSASFCTASYTNDIYNNDASTVDGCAPKFRVIEDAE
jgi:hypothetical protein